MKPTIGRIVHFVAPGGKHLPAIVYEVHNEGVALEIFGGVTPRMQSAVQLDESGTGFGTWHWPEKSE